MISLYRRLPLKWKENDWLHLVPFSDVHRGSPDHDNLKYRKFLQRCVERKDVLVLGMGEYEDPMSTSERTAWKQKDWHDGTVATFEEGLRDKLDDHVKLLKPLADTGRLLGLGEGHHYYVFQNRYCRDCKFFPQKGDCPKVLSQVTAFKKACSKFIGNEVVGITSTEYICEKLGVPYLGFEFMLTVSLPNIHKRSKNEMSFRVWGNHGKAGSGRDKGIGTLRNLCSAYEADVYLMAHNHQKAVDRSIMLYQGRPRRKELDNQILPCHTRSVVLARVGGFLKGHTTSKYPSYTELRAYPPTDIGVINVSLCWRREQTEGRDRIELDIHVSL